MFLLNILSVEKFIYRLVATSKINRFVLIKFASAIKRFVVRFEYLHHGFTRRTAILTGTKGRSGVLWDRCDLGCNGDTAISMAMVLVGHFVEMSTTGIETTAMRGCYNGGKKDKQEGKGCESFIFHANKLRPHRPDCKGNFKVGIVGGLSLPFYSATIKTIDSFNREAKSSRLPS